MSNVQLGSAGVRYVVGSSVASVKSFACSSSGLPVSVPLGLLTGSHVGSDHVSEISETEVPPREPSSPVPEIVAVFSTHPASTSA